MSPDEEFERRCREALEGKLEEGGSPTSVPVPDTILVADYHRVIEAWCARGWIAQRAMRAVTFASPAYLHAEIDRWRDEQLVYLGLRRADLQRQLEALDKEAEATRSDAARRHGQVDRGEHPGWPAE